MELASHTMLPGLHAGACDDVRHRPSRVPLRIWHVGAGASPQSVNGVNTAIWLIAAAQAELGHDVHLPVLTADGQDAFFAPRLTRHVVPGSRLRFDPAALQHLITTRYPDIVHIHSAFLPRHTLLGRVLRKEKIPYVVTPHGALLPPVLKRGRLKKFVYSLLFEKPYVRGASGVTGVTRHELDCLREFGKPSAILGRCILNPIPPGSDDIPASTSGSGRPFVLFLGRFDIVTKGLDRLIEIARHMPDADFHLYGRPHSRRDDLVLSRAPANVALHKPVYGKAKTQVLRNATLYLQASRWEAFSISVAEALAAGIPCAMTETLHQARILADEGATFTIPEDPALAAARLQELLDDSEALHRLSAQGRRFALENLAADRIAQEYVDFYHELLRPTQENDEPSASGDPTIALRYETTGPPRQPKIIHSNVGN